MQPTGITYTRPESRFIWLQISTPDGRKLRKSSKTTDQREAERRLQQEISRLSSLSFREAVVDFFEVKGRNLREKTLSNYRTSLRTVDPFLGHLTLFDIGREVLKDLVRERRKTVSDTSVRRDLAFVSSVFSHAIETMPGAPEHNPVLSFSKRHLKENERVRWLRPREYQKLLDACSNDMQQIILQTAVHTGMRHGELVALRKSMIDFDRKEITLDVDTTKSKRERVIPLCDTLCQSLEKLCSRIPGDLVFAYVDQRSQRWRPYTSFKSSWQGIMKRSGLENTRFHDLRHTFASWWVQSGGNLMHLRDILGHSSLQMVQRYAHLNTAAHHQEIRKVFGHSLDTEEDN